MNKATIQPRPLHDWHEDMGDVLWWLWPIEQAPWVGSPLDCGRTVSFDITVQIGVDLYEVQPQKVGDTGGWPWADADDETLARLFWTPLPDADALDEAIRDDIRGGPDPFKVPPVVQPAPPAEVGAIAVDLVIASLSRAQTDLLKVLRPHGDCWAYPVKVRGDGLQSCMALVNRGIVSLDNPRPYHNRRRGFVKLTPFGLALRDIIIGRAAA